MSEFKSGDKVLHPMFGPGVVAAVAGSGPEARITVDFSSSVGRKKLLAGVAKLRTVTADASVSVAPAGEWFEALDATAKPRPGRPVDAGKLHADIRTEVAKLDFWIAVRERMRSRGQMPQVIDDPNGRISIRATGAIELHIVVQHGAMADGRNFVTSKAIFDELQSRLLRDFERFSSKHYAGISLSLDNDNLVFIDDQELGDLPARDMRQRPKRVQPKGVFRSMPKRREDY